MSKRITFQFEDDLDYQLQAINSTVELFRGLSRHVDGVYRYNRIRNVTQGNPIRNNDIVVGSRLLENLRKVQLSNDLFADNALADGNNFTIEMETGTGKTYVYLRTILLLFTKLKKGGFVIDTPYGNYSPDWAVVCRKEALKDPSIGIYFIVETKAGKTWADLTDVEKNKIHCGELHFEAVSDDTKFDWVNGYEDFVNKFGVTESD